MGVWIETALPIGILPSIKVTPFVGVWIETLEIFAKKQTHQVTPFVGVWIETRYTQTASEKMSCHTLRGCVD